ncbi:VOC family protein [Aliivibrio kagoshimensis]|uniref:VOC family protein n=1 Tax=Aliivibrio kagoshimensis TaxID=2910230 RepID=UPI003D0D2BAB
MDDNNTVGFTDMQLSHFELYVQDIAKMSAFYTRHLGFVETDRGEGKAGMVFLSRSPNEHHQLVLNPRQSHQTVESPLDHISFRVASLSDLRGYYLALLGTPQVTPQTVSHGSTWSIYFRDPEGNRLEIFTDTPWHVNQPCKFDIDLTLSDQALLESTEQQIRDRPGFQAHLTWKAEHQSAIKADS